MFTGDNPAYAKWQSGVTYEYMNPNYKESLPREWWQTSFQILPTDEIMQKIKDLYSNIRGPTSRGTPKEGEEEKE